MVTKYRNTMKLFSLILLFPCFEKTLAQDETPQEIIAIQIRKQGFPCNNPISADKDIGESRADSPLWILNCDNQKYRVRLNPGMAAAVEKIN